MTTALVQDQKGATVPKTQPKKPRGKEVYANPYTPSNPVGSAQSRGVLPLHFGALMKALRDEAAQLINPSLHLCLLLRLGTHK